LLEEGFDLVTGGTDTHLMLLDLRRRQLPGKVFATALAKAGIITNANTIPGEPGSPKNPSGLRLGTPAVTSQGMGLQEMRWIAKKIGLVAKSPHKSSLLSKIRQEVKEMTTKFGAEPKF